VSEGAPSAGDAPSRAMLRAIAALEVKLGWEPRVDMPYRQRVSSAIASVRLADVYRRPLPYRQDLARAVRNIEMAERAHARRNGIAAPPPHQKSDPEPPLPELMEARPVTLPSALWKALDEVRRRRREGRSTAIRRLLEQAIEAERRARDEPPG
jgi:hypothetical protein